MNLTSYQKTRLGLVAWGAAGLLLTLGAVSLGHVAWVISMAFLLISAVVRALVVRPPCSLGLPFHWFWLSWVTPRAPVGRATPVPQVLGAMSCSTLDPT